MPCRNVMIVIVLCELCLSLLIKYEQLTNILLVFQEQGDSNGYNCHHKDLLPICSYLFKLLFIYEQLYSNIVDQGCD